MARQYKYVFGPVPSRRLGLSLGVDLVPFKFCTYDCIYCQLGRTTTKTIERRSYVPVEDVLGEIRRRIEEGARPDYVTLSGSGEPTLHSGIDEVIAGIKGVTDVPVAVLTNGSLLWMPEVRSQLAAADLVVPSLDAADSETFRKMDRPHEGIEFERMVAGLIDFRAGYGGRIWLEVFLIEGVNDADSEIEGMVKIARRIGPDKVQLNTIERPPAEEKGRALSAVRLAEIAGMFDPPTEVVVALEHVERGRGEGADEDIVAMVCRRPCTVDDVSAGLGINPSEVVKRVERLCREGVIEVRREGGKLFYVCAHGSGVK